jgi:hypothetical protein
MRPRLWIIVTAAVASAVIAESGTGIRRYRREEGAMCGKSVALAIQTHLHATDETIGRP